MPDRQRLTIVLAIAIAATAAGPVAAASAAVRYAAPYRSLVAAGAAPCTDSGNPCTLPTALAQAGSGDFVQLARGEYWKPVVFPGPGDPPPFDDPLAVPPGVTMHGIDGADLPVLHVRPNAAAEAGVLLGASSTVRDLAVEGTAAPGTSISYSLQLGPSSLAERVRVRTTAAPSTLQIACSHAPGAVLRSAVCHGIGVAGGGSVTGVSAASNTATYAIRNVTAITTAPSSVGISVVVSNGTGRANISNSIFRGTTADIRVRAGVTGGDVIANVDHSNWVTQSSETSGVSSAVLAGLGGNQNASTTAQPLFRDEAAGDFRSALGSPTIDAGVVDAGNNGPYALGGQDRWIGLTTDIGAHEFDPTLVPPLPPVSDPSPVAEPPSTGDPNPPLSTPITDQVAPRLTELSLARNVKRSKATRIRFRLSEQARVAIAFGQPKRGRSAGGKCRKATAKNRRAPRCTIPNVKGTLTVNGKPGANSLTFKGTIAKGKRLPLGKYTATATPTDAAGNRGKTVKRTFTLKR